MAQFVNTLPNSVIPFLLVIMISMIIIWALKKFIDMLTLPDGLREIVLVLVSLLVLGWLFFKSGLVGIAW